MGVYSPLCTNVENLWRQKTENLSVPWSPIFSHTTFFVFFVLFVSILSFFPSCDQ